MRVGRSEKGRGGIRENKRGFGDGVEDDFCFCKRQT